MAMKVLKNYLPILFSLFAFVSCGGDDEDDFANSNDNYYVKYEVTAGQQVSYAYYTDRSISYSDVDRIESFDVRNKEWEGTYGPFKKGQTVQLSVTTSGKTNSNARISVSINKEPFVVKAEQRESNNIKLSYTIDF